MRLLKYNLVAVFLDVLFTILFSLGHSESPHNMFFEMMMTIWLVTMFASILGLNILLAAMFKSIKTWQLMLISFILTHLSLYSIIASIDPNDLGFYKSLFSLYKEREMFYLMTVPYLLSTTAVLTSYFYFNSKSSDKLLSKLLFKRR